MEEGNWVYEASASPSSEPWHRHDDGTPIVVGQGPRQLPPTTIELKKREEDGALLLASWSQRESTEELPPARAEIARTLARLRDANEAERRDEATARNTQRDATRRLVQLMHLDSRDETLVVAHTAQVALQNEIRAIHDKMRRLEERYQQAKKALATIPDKNDRHHQVQLAKEERDIDLVPLRERLKALDPTARPSSSFQKLSGDGAQRLPFLNNPTPEKKASSAVYRQATDRIRELQKIRKSMVDPYMANLQMAKLWHRINDHERARENYETALKSLSDRKKSKIPQEDLTRVLELERRRKREALLFLFMRSLQLKEREEAARMMKKYLKLSTASERLPTVMHLEEILRNIEYVEDPSLSTPEEVTTSILCSKSLGALTDLRFDLLQELLTAWPEDPYLLESVANFHVRKHDFEDAKQICDRFVKLPDVKRIQLYASFAEYNPAPSMRSTHKLLLQ